MRKNESSQCDLLSQTVRAVLDVPIPEDRLEEALASTRKMLADIPTAKPTPRVWYRLPLARAAGLAAAALVLALALVHIFLRSDFASEAPDARAALLNDTSVSHVIGDGINSHVKETRPCDVLPPLPDWH